MNYADFMLNCTLTAENERILYEATLGQRTEIVWINILPESVIQWLKKCRE